MKFFIKLLRLIIFFIFLYIQLLRINRNGSIGVTDGSMVALLGGILNLSPGISSAVTILGRTADLWFSVILGIAFFFITLKYWTETVNKKKDKK